MWFCGERRKGMTRKRVKEKAPSRLFAYKSHFLSVYRGQRLPPPELSPLNNHRKELPQTNIDMNQAEPPSPIEFVFIRYQKVKKCVNLLFYNGTNVWKTGTFHWQCLSLYARTEKGPEFVFSLHVSHTFSYNRNVSIFDEMCVPNLGYEFSF